MINVKKFITKSNILKIRMAKNKTQLTTLNGDKIKISARKKDNSPEKKDDK